VSRCVLFTFILRGDVLAPHSGALEIGESVQRRRTRRARSQCPS
jgi:hypothetical protein